MSVSREQFSAIVIVVATGEIDGHRIAGMNLPSLPPGFEWRS